MSFVIGIEGTAVKVSAPVRILSIYYCSVSFACFIACFYSLHGLAIINISIQYRFKLWNLADSKYKLDKSGVSDRRDTDRVF